MKRLRPRAAIIRTTDGYKATVTFKDGALAVKFMERVIAEVPNLQDFFVVDRLMTTPPPGDVRRPFGRYWCPYCADWRRFRAHEDDGYLKCEICEISESEYHVRRFNKLWKTDMSKKQYDTPQEAHKAARRQTRRQNRKGKEKANGK